MNEPSLTNTLCAIQRAIIHAEGDSGQETLSREEAIRFLAYLQGKIRKRDSEQYGKYYLIKLSDSEIEMMRKLIENEYERVDNKTCGSMVMKIHSLLFLNELLNKMRDLSL